jgi:Ca2+-binding RTX toxin-like protein
MRRVLLAATVVALLVQAAPAAASTLTLVNGTLTFTGSGASANDLTLSGNHAGTLIEINDSDTVSPSGPPGCTPIGNSFACAANLVVLDLGAGADTVTIDNAGLTTPTSMLGGEGVDQLDGGAAADILDGGAGNDVLDGGAGVDQIIGGTGNDVIDGGPDADSSQ